MKKNNYKNIKLKIILILFTFGVLFSFILTNKILFGEKIHNIVHSNSVIIFYEKKRIFEEFLDLARNQLNSINKSHFFKEFLESGEINKSKDLFLAIARTSSDIMQVRYIDKNGNEIIRVDRSKISSPVFLVPQNELQNKKDRYYFTHSITNANENIWFSSLDLNIENKKVQVPFNPTIRAMLPLQKNGEFNGVIIINYFMEDFLNNLKENNIYNTVLFDTQGYTLTHYEKEKSWGFYLKEKYNLKTEYKNEIENALKYNEYKDKDILIKKFDFGISSDLYMLIKLKDNYLQQLNNEHLKENILVSIIVLVLTLISSIFLTKVFNNMSRTISDTDDRLKEASVLVKLSYFKYNYQSKLITFDDNFFNLLNYDYSGKKSYTLDELKNFFTGTFLDKLKTKINSIKDEDSFEFEVFTSDNNKLIFFTKSRAIYENGMIIELEGIFQDITKQKKLVKSLEEAKIEAENANQSKSKFLANMSHEIRTPLNGIIGLNKLALQSNPNLKIKEFLLKSKISSMALLNVINDILDYSKIEANKLSLEYTTFDLDKLLLNVSNLFDYEAYNKGISLRIDYDKNIPSALLGDPHRITQIFNNLVGNAVKFTKAGYIEIKTTLFEKKNNKLILKCSVKDTGIGMSEREQEKLFKSFSQVDSSTTRVYGGSGLGLTITKELVELMNGSIEVKSKKDIGSIFSFTLSLDYQNNVDLKNSQVKSNSIEDIKEEDNYTINAKILVAEDNEINQTICAEMLKEIGINVSLANNGLEAVEMCKDEDYDMILMDIHMPIMNGFEATKHIREFNKEIPIIALTAAVLEEDRSLSKEAGMQEHLGKPIDFDELVRNINKYLPHLIHINKKKEIILDNSNPHIDFNELLNRVGSEELANELLNTFVSSYHDYKNELRDSFESENFDKNIHKLKGVSGNLSLKVLYETSIEIENETNLDKRRTLLDKLLIELDEIIVMIKNK